MIEQVDTEIRRTSMDIKIFTGVPIYTLDSENSIVEAVVVLNGKIVFTGSFDEAKAKYSYSEEIKLNEGILMPGFIEPHIDLAKFSNMYRDLDLSDVKSKEELIELINSYVKNKKESKWVLGGGLNYKLIEEITRKDLDKVSSFNPVLLYSWDFHTAVVNTRALEISGIDYNYQNPMEGTIKRDGNGEITGVLKDRAIDIITKFVDSIDSRKNMKSLESGIEKLLSMGITTFCDFSSNSSGVQGAHIKQLMLIYRKNELKNRIIFMIDDKEAEFLNRVGITSNFGSENFLLGGVKLIVDGTLSAMTAYMRKPYIKSKSNGVLLYNENEMYRLVREFYKSYFWTSIQAIGDGANNLALKVYERLSKERAIPNLLKRIDYAESLSDEDIDSFAKNDVIPVLTPAHIPYIRKKAIDLLLANARSLFRIGSLIKAGVKVAFASDAPVVYPDPFHAIYCAVERKDYYDGPEFRFYPREHIDIVDSVKAVTINAAYACGIDDKVGSIEKGKRADMIQLSKDIFSCEMDDFKYIKVLRAFIDGTDVSEQ